MGSLMMSVKDFSNEWEQPLTPSEAAQFAEQLKLSGIVGPFRVCDEEYAERLAKKFLSVGEKLDDEVASTDDPSVRQLAMRNALLATRNRHLYDTDVRFILEQPSLISRLSASLGDDLVCWRTQAFVQYVRRQESGVAPLPWHRDNYLTLLDSPRTNVSVHMALTTSSKTNCMRVLTGSHQLSDEELFSAYGLQHIDGSEQSGPGTSRYVGDVLPGSTGLRSLEMRPGEAVLFTDRLVHASSWTDDPAIVDARVAFAIRVTIPAVRVLPMALQECLPRQDHPVTLTAK